MSKKNSYTIKISDYSILDKKDLDILVNDFVEFYLYVFWVLDLPVPTRAQIEIARFISNPAYDKRMAQAMRGLGKSLTSQIYTVWRLLRNQDEKIAVLSASQRRSVNWTTFVLNLIRRIPITSHIAPRPNQRKSATSFDVDGATPADTPSVVSYGVDSQVTGARSTIVIYDDIEVLKNSASAQLREKLLMSAMEAMNTTIAGRSEAIILCTPQSQESVYNEMESKGFTPMHIPSEYPLKSEMDKYESKLPQYILDNLKADESLHGTPIDERLDEIHLAKKKLEIGMSQYRLQYMLDTAMSDLYKYPLRLSDFIVYDLDREIAPRFLEHTSNPDYAVAGVKSFGFPGDRWMNPSYVSDDRSKYEQILMIIDPSGRGTDSTGFAVIATLHGRIYLLDFGGLEGGYSDETLYELANIAKDYKVNEVVIEDNFGDGMFTKIISPIMANIHPCSIEEIKSVTNKEMRIINTIEPLLNQHRIVISKQAIIRDVDKYKNNKDYSFAYQLTHITQTAGSLKHDDTLDVVGIGIEYVKEAMERDVIKSAKQESQKDIDAQLEEFLARITGKKQTNDTYIKNY